jgi:SNF2 family DNA or RNA helicase
MSSNKKSNDNKTFLITDKYVAGSRAYNHKLTKDITVETLFLSDYKCVESTEALQLYNKYNSGEQIPTSLLSHNGLYNLNYFVFTNNGLDYRIMILIVDNDILIQHHTNGQAIPDVNFLMTACKDNSLYSEGGVPMPDKHAKKTAVDKNVKEITENAVKPNADSTDPILKQPDYAKLNMYPYQKKTTKWMLSRELERRSICIDKDDVSFGDIVYDIPKKKFLNINSRNYVEFHGGALVDEVGLGKTYQMIATSLENRVKNFSYTTTNSDKVNSKATLIICPNQLVGQWAREMDNVIKSELGLKIIPFFTKIHFDKYTYEDLLNADFVVTSFHFLSNQCFLNPFVSKISKVKSYMGSTSYSYTDVQKTLDDMKKDLKNNLTKKLKEKEGCILLLDWHRIVIDEFHELYCVSKYKSVQKLIKHFKGNYKWCLTGTPFDKSDTCLYGMFDFITNYTYDFTENSSDLWTNNEVTTYMKKYFFRRNTKKSVEDENKLPPLKENIVWLNFSNTERMMYNAYLANPNTDRFSVTLRQLCCHPKIADDIKTAISNCKSLDEIETTMIKFYETTMSNAHKKTKIIKYRIECLNRRLEIAEWKQYARTLRHMGYRVKFALEDNINEKYEKEMQELINSLKDDDIDNIPTFQEYDDVLKDDDDDKSKKKLIIASNANKSKILNMIKGEIGDNTVERSNIEKSIEDAIKKQDIIVQDYKGKKSTYDYYTDVMGKLKKTSDIENPDSDSDSDEEDEKEKCGVCLSNITGNDLGMTKCGHIFCYNCIKPFIASKGKCPYPGCNHPIKESEIYMIIKNKQSDETQQEFKDKQELVKLVGTKLANLIFFLKKNNKHAIIFSQWDDMLRRVGDILNEYGIKNVFCKGNVWQRDKAVREFNADDKIKVIMLSSESAASGTNLTKAEMVILLDPVYGTYEYRRNTEWQAIGRAYRTGQTKQVKVIRFITKNTVEEEIYEMNKKADLEQKKNEKVTEISEDTIKLDESQIKQLMDTAKEKKEKKIATGKIKNPDILFDDLPKKKKTINKSKKKYDSSSSDNDDSDSDNSVKIKSK